MRALILILSLSFANFSQASQMQFSDLSEGQQKRIVASLQDFLPTYKNALEIALHNVKRKAVGTMNSASPMSEVVLENGTAEGMFAKVAELVSDEASMKNFGDMRGIQTYTQANKEAAQAESLSFHVHHKTKWNNMGWNAKAWMKHMNSQVEVVRADQNGATVRLLHFPRNCTITANSNSKVRQHCN